MKTFELRLPAVKAESTALWLGVHAAKPGLLAECRGLYRVAWELHADPERVRILLAAPEVYAETLQGEIYRAWPGADLGSERDPLRAPETVWVAAPSMHFAYSLARQPSGALWDALSSIPDGRACIQVVVRPAGTEWVKAAQEARARVEAGQPLPSRRLASLADGLAGTLDALVGQVFGEAPKVAAQGPKPPRLDKASEAGFVVAVRLGASGRHRLRVLSSLGAALRQERGEAEWLTVRPLPGLEGVYREALRRRLPATGGCVLGLTELAALTAPPGPGRGKVDYARSGMTEPAESLIAGIEVTEGAEPEPAGLRGPGLPLGTVRWRGEERLVALPDRLTDTLVHPKVVVGSMEAGKTTLGTNLVVAAAELGYGSLFIDKADGAALHRICRALPASMARDLVWLDFTDLLWPIALSLSEELSRITGGEFNPVGQMIGQQWEHLFVRHFAMAAQTRSRMLFRKACSAVFEDPEATLLEVRQFLADDAFRARHLEHVRDRRTRLWWAEFTERRGPERRELTDPILNKLDAWLDMDILRRIVAQRSKGLDLRALMDQGAIILAHINEAPSALGPEVAALLGTLLVTKAWVAAVGRYDVPEESRRPFFLVCDEPFGYLAAGAVYEMLGKARKYRLCPVFMFQSTAQVKDEDPGLLKLMLDIRPHLLIGATGEDTWRDLRHEIAPLTVEEAVSLPKYHFVTRLHVGADAVPAFILKGLPPLEPVAQAVALTDDARHRYARPARVVEDDILEREGYGQGHATGGGFRRKTGWDRLA